MITGNNTNTSETSYREKSVDSSSSLKDFSLDRKKYFKKYVLLEEVEEKDNQSIKMGQLVELLLLEPNRFDEKFSMSACASIPTNLMLNFVEALYKYTKNATNEEGVVMREFKDISQDAYVESGFKIKYEAVIQKFAGSDAEIYFNEILKVRTQGLTVVTTEDVTNAEKIVEELKTNFVTKDIINLVNSVNWEVHNQLQVEGYEINGLPMKSMMDKIIINHIDKVIYVYDLKTTWASELFYREYYLYRRAYIQAYVYHVAIQHYRNINFPGYSIQPIKFIVCDSTNYYNPLIYKLTFEDLKEAKEGFEYKGTKYPGVTEIVDNLKFAIENNLWNISKTNYLLNGIVNLKD